MSEEIKKIAEIHIEGGSVTEKLVETRPPNYKAHDKCCWCCQYFKEHSGFMAICAKHNWPVAPPGTCDDWAN